MNIALVAHDGRKKELLEWVKYNAEALMKHQLFATGTTGKLIQEMFIENDDRNMFPLGTSEKKTYYEQKVTRLLSGPLGGDQQIGSMIATGKIDVLIFFCDNLLMQGHQNDVSALSRLASLYNIPFATNRTTADMIMTSPLFGNPEYKRVIPASIDNYTNRQLNTTNVKDSKKVEQA